MLKVIHGLTPMHMTDNIVMAKETHDRDTRLSDSNDVRWRQRWPHWSASGPFGLSIYQPIIQM